MDNHQIRALLADMRDPDSGAAFLSSGILRQLELDGKAISITLGMREIQAPYKAELNSQIQTRILAAYPDAQVDIHFEALQGSEKYTRTLPQVKQVIAIASGKGGVGKSTVSTLIARQLHTQGHKVGILDADLYGPSVPIIMGLQGAKPKIEKLMGTNKIIPLEKDGLHVMSIGFVIDPAQAVVLRGPRLAGIIKQFVHDTSWPDLDYLIIDLPPGTGDIQLTLVQTLALTGAVMVTTPSELSVADAIKAANMFRLPNVAVPILGVIENMSYFQPVDAPEKRYEIFGAGGGEKLAREIDSEVIAQLPILKEMSSTETFDRKVLENQHYKKLYDRLMARISWRNETMVPTQQVKMQS